MNIRPNELAVLRTMFHRFPVVQEVRVFGSRATDTARRASDLDLAISAPNATTAQWADICEAVENIPLIYELDIVRPERTVNPRLQEKIAREGVVIYPDRNAA